MELKGTTRPRKSSCAAPISGTNHSLSVTLRASQLLCLAREISGSSQESREAGLGEVSSRLGRGKWKSRWPGFENMKVKPFTHMRSDIRVDIIDIRSYRIPRIRFKRSRCISTCSQIKQTLPPCRTCTLKAKRKIPSEAEKAANCGRLCRWREFKPAFT